MTKKREKLLDLVIAKFGHEHPTTIKVAKALEVYPQCELADMLLTKTIKTIINK